VVAERGQRPCQRSGLDELGTVADDRDDLHGGQPR
jgi:hypothetical protein